MDGAVVGEEGSSPPSKLQRLSKDEDEYPFFAEEASEETYVALTPSDEDNYEYEGEYWNMLYDDKEDDDEEDVLRLMSSKDEPGPMKDGDAPPLLPRVNPLPDGAWELWGSQAVYFAAEDIGAYRHTYPGNIIYTGLSIFVINPTDQQLPVYHVFDFSFPTLKPVEDLRFAIVGSLAYVAGSARLWMRQLGGDKNPGCWVDGPSYDMYNCTPLLFSLGGTLCALCCFCLPDPCGDPSPKAYPDAFQVLVDGSWRSLNAPPPCMSCSGRMIGLSCISDHTIIVHVGRFEQQRFYCFHRHTEGFGGEWTELDVATSPPPPFMPPLLGQVAYCAHLASNHPLFLPVLSRTTMSTIVFGLSGDLLHLRELGQEVKLPWEEPYHTRLYLLWNLISMGGNRYCAFAFPYAGRLDVDILTFDLHLDGGAAPSVKIVHSRRHHGLWNQAFRRLWCGKAHFSSN